MLTNLHNTLIYIIVSKIISGQIFDTSTRRTRPILNATKIKFILTWTMVSNLPPPFNQNFDLGVFPFREQSCFYQNCYYTSDKNLFDSYADFHAILFHGKEMENFRYPKKRRSNQYYAYVMDESAVYYGMDKCYLDDFFNLTVTYRLDSDIPWPYYKIIDKTDRNAIVGPRIDMNWKKGLKKLNQKFLAKLFNKTKLAAWFVSNCGARNDRALFAHILKQQIHEMSNLSIDVFGSCSPLRCPNERYEDCDQMLSDNYLFYLAFENSNTEDYVTEKLLRALQNDVVPIVYGGANYSRFLPPGSYLDARSLGARKTAIDMIYLYWHRKIYARFFDWKGTYEFKDNVLGFSCGLCAVLNTKMNVSHENFVDWWTGRTSKLDPPDTICNRPYFL